MIDVETSTNCAFALSTQRATLYRSMSFFGTEGFFFAKDRKKIVIIECNTNYLFPQRPCVNRDPLTQSICERIFFGIEHVFKGFNAHCQCHWRCSLPREDISTNWINKKVALRDPVG